MLLCKKQAISNYIRDADNLPKAAWEVINANKCKSKHQLPCTSITSNEFNDFFSNVAKNIVNVQIPSKRTAREYLSNHAKAERGEITFSFREITFNEVKRCDKQC